MSTFPCWQGIVRGVEVVKMSESMSNSSEVCNIILFINLEIF